MQPLFSHLSIETAKAYALVLTSVGIPHRIHSYRSFWAISVEIHHRRSAMEAISLYINENRPEPATDQQLKLISVRTYSAFYICAVLMLIHLAVVPGYERQVFVNAFGV